jgi:hypothetical protein
MTVTTSRSARHAGPRARPRRRLAQGRQRTPGSTRKTRQRHRKAVATPCPPVSRPTESSRSSRPVTTARHPAAVKSP